MVTYHITVRKLRGRHVVSVQRSCDDWPLGEYACRNVAEGVAAVKHAVRYQRRGGLLARVGA